VNNSETADIMVGEKIFQYYFSLGSAVRSAFIIKCDLYQVIEMSGDPDSVTFLNGTQDLIHSDVERTECDKGSKNKNQS
jgi:hypothetical protein